MKVIIISPSARAESSTDAGRPRKKARLTWGKSGMKSDIFTWMPCMPRRRMTMPMIEAMLWLASVVSAAPITP